MFRKKTISSKKIGEVHQYNSYTDIIKPKNKKGNLFKIFVVVFCVIVVGFCGKYILQAAQLLGSQIEKGAVNVVSNSLGKEMTRDGFGNVNIMIIGYGGANHDGGNLADSIMVVSWNPELGALTMISVPRDLYVAIPEKKIYGRINELFARGMRGKQEYQTGAQYVKDQLEKMMGLEIGYYALVDFDGFEGLINALGGIDIHVKHTIRDTTYPDDNRGYKTFYIEAGDQHIDGATALMYARSRHTTSDFSRSLRQQEIIKALASKMTTKEVLLSPSKIKELYASYTKMVKTNITIDEMIGMAKHAYELKHMFSFGFTNECSNASWRLSTPACFLHSPSPEKFGGAMVLIPASPGAVDANYYDYTKNFALFVAHNQEYLIEAPRIVIQNGIEKSYAKSLGKRLDGYANKIGVRLNKYGFDVVNVENAMDNLSGTTVYIQGTGEYTKTIETLKYFVPITTVTQVESGQLLTATPDTDIVLVLGNDYLDKTQGQFISYYK